MQHFLFKRFALLWIVTSLGSLDAFLVPKTISLQADSRSNKSPSGRVCPCVFETQAYSSKLSLKSPIYSRSVKLNQRKTSDSEFSDKTPAFFSWSMIALPFASILLPKLLALAKSLPANSSEQLLIVTSLFVVNRAYLYMMAVTIVGLAAARGSNDSPQLGRRITDLTEELIYRPMLDDKRQNKGRVRGSDVTDVAQDVQEKPSLIKSLSDSGIEESLDAVSTETQALILPLLVSFLLALSIFFLPFWTTSSSFALENNSLTLELQNALSEFLPAISQVWNTALLALFTRSEVRRLRYEQLSIFLPDSILLEWSIAIAINVLAVFFQLWPAQNFVNMALAIQVARVIQLDSFAAIIGALLLLTVYDATSVFLIPSASAVDTLQYSSNAVLSNSIDIASKSTAASSAMGSVAIQKLSSSSFQPGLLVTKIGNSLGGSLGLGDAVFPTLLVNFVRRFDNAKFKEGESNRISLFAMSLVGYMVGCVSGEFAPLISTSGLPALIFIIPFMIGTVLITALLTDELEELINFDPNLEA